MKFYLAITVALCALVALVSATGYGGRGYGNLAYSISLS